MDEQNISQLAKYRRPLLFAVGAAVVAFVAYNYGIASETNKQISYGVQDLKRLVLRNGFVASSLASSWAFF